MNQNNPKNNSKKHKNNKSKGNTTGNNEAPHKLPQDTKVVLIDEQTFSALCLSDSHSVKTGKPAMYSRTDFPILGAESLSTIRPLSPSSMSCAWDGKKLLSDPFPELGASSVKSKPLFQAADVDKSSLATCVAGSDPSKKQNKSPIVAEVVATNSKKKRSKNPIVLDFFTVIKKQNLSKKLSKNHMKLKRLHTVERLSGNILDSSNPVRSKGKFRETKKKKLSPLKAEIIKDRIINSLQYQQNKEHVDLKKEVELYVSNMKTRSKQFPKKKSKEISEKGMASPVDQIKKTERTSAVFSTMENKPSEEMSPVTIKKLSHSSKFRDYCDNMLTLELDDAVTSLIKSVVSLQDRAFERDPLRARIRKRHVTGLRETLKYLNLKKVKLVVVAPDLEKSSPDGAITRTVNNIKHVASNLNVPYVFALNRRVLGNITLKKNPVSSFAVLSYSGIEPLFESAILQLNVARNIYGKRFGEQNRPADDTTNVIIPLLEKIIINCSESERSSTNQNEEPTTADANSFMKVFLGQ